MFYVPSWREDGELGVLNAKSVSQEENANTVGTGACKQFTVVRDSS